jgi:hypothetical protein
MRIKDWHKFQHFKDRRPPWIKLYRELLDDPEWHELDAFAAKCLTMIWLVASEYDGEIPPLKKLAFRLRISEERMTRVLGELSHWIENSGDGVISDQYYSDAPDTEGETETETEGETENARKDDFETFWKAYPRKASKGQARKAYIAALKRGIGADVLLAGARRYASDTKRDPDFTKHAATWINGECWLDEPLGGDQATAKVQWADKVRLAKKAFAENLAFFRQTKDDARAMFEAGEITAEEAAYSGFQPAELTKFVSRDASEAA